jgi:hypothetical protein
MESVTSPTRELTYHERAVWGTCPVCHAPHGTPCDPNVGIPLISGVRAHLARVNNAPRRVREVPA